MAKKIITTLEQYNKKYRNRRYRLLKVTKKEVEDFDKKFKYTDHYLLKGRKWVLIDETYYEIPKAPRYTWFRNLHAACQAGTCVLAAGIVATAVTLPIVLNKSSKYIVNQNQWENAFSRILDDSKERNVTIDYDANSGFSIDSEQHNFKIESSALIQTSLKISNDKEYGKAYLELGDDYNPKTIRNENYYQKKIDNSIVEKQYTKINDGEWAWNHETYELDPNGYQSSNLYISEVKQQYNNFSLQKNIYIGKLKVDVPELEAFGIIPELTFKIEFDNTYIKYIDFSYEHEQEVDMSPIGMCKLKSGMHYTLTFKDYGTTSFEMPE